MRSATPTPLAADPMYDRVFWLAYAANTLMMVCVSLLFRYADFVTFRGGDEFDLGLIVGTGMVGALAARGFLAAATDRYGPRRVWAGSLLIVIISLLAHLLITSVDQPWVYLARIVFMVGLAGAFGASITFMSLRAPPGRLGEMVGTIGSSGFIGVALGPILGDWLFAGGTVAQVQVQRMFLLAALAVAASLVCMALATAGALPLRQRKRRHPPIVRLILRYHPGPILIVAGTMGAAVMLPHTFLRPYTQHLGISGIRTFFFVYAVAAFSVRIVTRQLTDRLGVRPVIQLGLATMALSMLAYIAVRSEAWLALPAALGGLAHAFLFPAVVTGGSTSFPSRYRGLATTLVLAMFDVANLVCQPIIGGVVEYAPRFGLNGYATMFTGMAVVMIAGAIVACAIDVEHGA